jgi:hypothetical protein
VQISRPISPWLNPFLRIQTAIFSADVERFLFSFSFGIFLILYSEFPFGEGYFEDLPRDIFETNTKIGHVVIVANLVGLRPTMCPHISFCFFAKLQITASNLLLNEMATDIHALNVLQNFFLLFLN